jgi:hypothetical protein
MTSDTWGRYHAFVDRLVHAVLDTPGATEASLRQTVEAQAANLGGRTGSAPAVPQGFDRYAETVGRWAWKVTDADVAALKAAGKSEDAIFEVTVTAATGAAVGRLERGLAALRGAAR